MKESFTENVYKKTKKVPAGKVTTYKDIAVAIGNSRLARAVGNALHKNKDIKNIPCHRVVRSDGFVGGYMSGTGNKIKKLRIEGIIVKNKKINLKRFRFRFK